MRLGIDGRALCGRLTGVGKWAWSLLYELPNFIPNLEVFAYAPEGFDCAVPKTLESFHTRRSKTPPWMSGFFWLKLRSDALIRQDPLTVFWATRTLYPSGLLGRTPTVSTVYDVNVRVAPQTMPLANQIAHRLWFKADVLNATKVVAISEGTSARLCEWTNIKADAIVPPGVDSAFRPKPDSVIADVRRHFRLEHPYLLFVGTLEPRKNLQELLLAHQLFCRRRAKPLDLVLVGMRGWRNKGLTRLLDDGMAGVHELGFVSDSDMPGLYSGAEAFVIPSVYEGYGMPAAEARACGTRVVATDSPELRESAGPDAVYVAPTAEGIARGLEVALREPKSCDPRPRTWRESARILANVLIDAAA